MANRKNVQSSKMRPETAWSSQSGTSSEDLQRSVDEFGDKLRRLKEQEPHGLGKEWLDDAERRNHSLMIALEVYGRQRAEQLAKSPWETARRNVQTSYQSLEEHVQTATNNLAEGFRKFWDGLSKGILSQGLSRRGSEGRTVRTRRT